MRFTMSIVAGVLVVAAGCQSYSRPVEKTENMMSRTELDARGDDLIRQGENRRLVGMSYGSNMQRRAGPNRLEIIRQGEDMIDHGRRLKAAAATRPS